MQGKAALLKIVAVTVKAGYYRSSISFHKKRWRRTCQLSDETLWFTVLICEVYSTTDPHHLPAIFPVYGNGGFLLYAR